MTEEEKELLFKDLCARAPYGTSIAYNVYGKLPIGRFIIDIHELLFEGYDIEHCKPYLRPLSNMTEEERKEWRALDKVLKTALKINRLQKDGVEIDEAKAGSMIFQAEAERDQMQIDWLNAHHFDYRNLIEKGLALEAPKDMYDLNNERK